MADGVFNIAKGRVAHYATLPESSDALIVVLLKSSGLQADGTLADHDTLAAVLGSNSEADFTNYARKTLSGVTVNVDDSNDRVDVDASDITYTAAGGASNNTIGKLLICYDANTGSGTDADIIPLTYHDASFTTDGTDQTIQFAAAGFYRAS